MIVVERETMNSILIKDTTKEQREQIVAESIGNINGGCDGCMSGLADMYQDYIDGKREYVILTWNFVPVTNPASKDLRRRSVDINCDLESKP